MEKGRLMTGRTMGVRRLSASVLLSSVDSQTRAAPTSKRIEQLHATHAVCRRRLGANALRGRGGAGGREEKGEGKVRL